jgi:hypothetical protein
MVTVAALAGLECLDARCVENVYVRPDARVKGR